jgi:hypothetical protein
MRHLTLTDYKIPGTDIRTIYLNQVERELLDDSNIKQAAEVRRGKMNSLFAELLRIRAQGLAEAKCITEQQPKASTTHRSGTAL